MTRRPRPAKRIRVRSKRLDQLDESKLALALWLMAKHELEVATTTDPLSVQSSPLGLPPASRPETT